VIVDTLGPAHLAILAAVPAGAWALATSVRGRPRAARRVRAVLAAAIGLNELAWYAYAVRHGWLDPPAGLPLDLCDVAVWLTVVALALPAPRPFLLEVVYYVGIAGSGMALLTPDVAGGTAAFPAVEFFVVHGAVVGSALFLVWSGALRPRPGSWWRVFLAVNGWAVAVGLVDLRFGTNYMYLREKPAGGTLLDLLGPWPWYLLGGEAVAALLLWLLQLPFRGEGGRERGSPPARPAAGR
jgi:hypothetical integral membrane protein (TIGR02206 family)